MTSAAPCGNVRREGANSRPAPIWTAFAGRALMICRRNSAAGSPKGWTGGPPATWWPPTLLAGC